MAFTAYWKTTTGFNTQDYPVTIGKKLKECSVAELTGHPMCGSMSLWGNVAFTAKSSDLAYSDVMPHLTGGVMFKEPIISNKSDIQVNEPANTGDTAKIYRRSIFIAWKSNVSLPQHSIDDTCSDDIYIVDNITAPNKLVCNYTNVSGLGTGDNAAVKARVCGYQLRHTCQKGQTAYGSAPSQLVYTDNTDPNHPITTNYYLGTAFVYVVDDNAFVVIDDHVGHFGFRWQSNNTSNQYNFLSDGADYKSFKSANNYRFFIGMNPNGTNREATLAEIFPGCFADPVPDPAVFVNSNSYTTTVSTILGSTIKLKFSLYNSTIGGAMASRGLNFSLSGDTALEARLQQICRQGTYFVFNGELLKPIIVGGVVVGYGTPEKVSEIDTYRDLNHPVPTGPGGGGGGGDDSDDPWHGVNFGGTGAGGGGAFCSVYYMTAAQLSSLKNWSNTSAPEGFDMLPSIIGLQQLPVSVSGVPTTVKFLRSGATTQQGETRVVDTGVAAGSGTGQPISFSLGHVNINRRMKQRGEPYLDYDCTVELFLPFAGTFVLDTQAVMGRTINAEIVIDPVNGSAFAYAWVSQGGQKMPIAYGGSSIAVDLPVASNQWGISRAAIKQMRTQAVINTVKDVGDFIVGLGIFKTGHAGAIANRKGFAALDIKEGLQAKQIGGQMMFSSAINAATDVASSIINTHQLNNTNYTAVNGSFGGSYAEWAQPFTAYVRITRPKFQKPSNFNHTQAVPCVEAKKLSACSGLTVCVNPDCGSISCTEAEKLMITQALVGGVYAGGGGQ